MSLAGILSSNLFQFNSQGVQDRMQQFRQDFQKLGQDVQTGNLTGAQADFAALQKDGPQSSSSTQDSNPITQAFQQLSTDLQSGNLTTAQQDYTNLQTGLSEPGSFAHAAFASSSSFRRRRGEQPDVANPVSTGAGPAVG